MQKAHGRIDHHDITLRSVDPLNVNFPHVETVIRVRRDSTAFKDTKDRLPGYYLSSRCLQTMSPEQWLGCIREQDS